MSVTTFFPQAREEISEYVDRFFNHKQTQLSYLDPTSREAFKKLRSFVHGGKMLRGAMSLMMYEMLTGKKSQSVVPMAAAIEMLGSVLLIHDDIIDRDRLRRGQPSVFAQYEEYAEEHAYHDPAHFGVSMGICVGDIGFFALHEMLGDLSLSPERILKLTQLLARESQVTGVAEMIDTERALLKKDVTVTDIETLYIAKTARYTFCLPLLAGAIAAGASEKTLKTLDALGEDMGLLFQIKDDELGLFGTAKQIGKSADSDVREGKRTLYYLHVMELATAEQRQKLSRIFGNAKVSEAQLQFVRDIVETSGARAKVDQRLQELEHQAKLAIAKLGLKDSQQQTLLDFLEYNLLRKR